MLSFKDDSKFSPCRETEHVTNSKQNSRKAMYKFLNFAKSSHMLEDRAKTGEHSVSFPEPHRNALYSKYSKLLKDFMWSLLLPWPFFFLMIADTFN
jgi:hypothetical protein